MNSKQIGALRRTLEYITLFMLLSSISLIAKAGSIRDYCSNSSAYNRSVYVDFFYANKADLLELGLTGEDILTHKLSVDGLEDRDLRLSSSELIGLCIKAEERARKRIIHKQKSKRNRGFLKAHNQKVLAYCQDVSAGSYVSLERCIKTTHVGISASPQIVNSCKNTGETYLEIEKCVTREVRARQQKLDAKTNKTDIQSIMSPVRFNGVHTKGAKASDQIVEHSCKQLNMLLSTDEIKTFKYSAESFNQQLTFFKKIKRYIEVLDTQFSTNDILDLEDAFITKNSATIDAAIFKDQVEMRGLFSDLNFTFAESQNGNDFNAEFATKGLLELANIAQAFCIYHKYGSAAALEFFGKHELY